MMKCDWRDEQIDDPQIIAGLILRDMLWTREKSYQDKSLCYGLAETTFILPNGQEVGYHIDYNNEHSIYHQLRNQYRFTLYYILGKPERLPNGIVLWQRLSMLMSQDDTRGYFPQ